MKYFIIVFTIVSFSFKLSAQELSVEGGSTVVAYVENSRIFIAADSKQLRVNLKTGDSIPSTICKIGHVGNVCYGFTGNLKMYANKIEIFNIYSIMNETLSLGLQFDEVWPVFLNNLKNHTLQAISKFVSYHYDTSKPFLSLLVITYKNDKPFLAHFEYKFKYNTCKQIELQQTEGDASFNTADTGRIISFIGYRSNIHEFLQKNQYLIYSNQKTEYKLTKLINLEIEKNKQYVDGPIDILELKKNDYEWITHNQECN